MPTDRLQVPPQAIDAEKAVLGSMLIEGDAVEKAIAGQRSRLSNRTTSVLGAGMSRGSRGSQ